MNPIVMALVLTAALAGFALSVRRRWRLLRTGGPAPRFDRGGERVRRTLRQALGQQRLPRYRRAGVAHAAIFFGFLVLLLRSLILLGRGFSADPGFGYGLFHADAPIGQAYGLLKDAAVVAVIAGTVAFLVDRLILKPSRLTLSREGLVILLMIVAMMVADVVYDGASHALAGRADAAAASFAASEPLGSTLALALRPLPDAGLAVLRHAGFWTHVVLVLLFLNLLPWSKHFHVITAIPNVFFQDLGPAGRLRPIEDLEGRVEREEVLGVRRIDDLSWKGLLDLYTCTECGRCTDQCPAARTGKLLSPKQLTMDLRGFLYEHAPALVGDGGTQDATADDAPHRRDLVGGVIPEEVIWACTTCGACEQECPLLISYVDKIVDLRRHVVQERGEAPAPLQTAFQSLEVTGSPYGVPAEERLAWAEGLDVKRRAEVDEPDVLLWVGCGPATDERARSIVRAVARLLDAAGVRWAVLGEEERCTGDVARRAGNEYLFQMMAEANVEILNGYGTTTIVTACPHCFNTLKHEYPDFGGRYEVIHHTEYLARLVADGRLAPRHRVERRIAFHDSCYLGRLNDVYDPPRDLLRAIPGVEVVEPAAARDRGMCCGAGGAQMFKEDEPGDERVSTARARQLLDTGAGAVASACPFCLRMLTDALADRDEIDELDVAEVLLESVIGPEPRHSPRRAAEGRGGGSGG